MPTKIKYVKDYTLSDSIETGVRAVDILAPIKRGGDNVIVGSQGLDHLVNALVKGIKRDECSFLK